MALDLFNEFAVLGDCDQCGRLFMFDGKNARARYTTAKAKFGIDLCQMCVAARQAGRFEFACQGCNSTVIGSLEEVKPLLNCFGKAFCSSCRTAFFGRWDPLNAAMVMLARRSRRRPPKRDRDPAALCRAYEVERDYCRKVRTLSRRHVMLHTELLNPMGHRLGRAGQSGAYQIDHVVPVTKCFAAEVAIELAAHPSNLRIIPWFVNVSRNNHFRLDTLIDWPGYDTIMPSPRRRRPKLL